MSLRGAIAEAVVAIRADGSEFGPDVTRMSSAAGVKAGSAFGEHFKRRAKATLAVGGAALFAGITAGLRTGFNELTDYQTGLSNLRAGLKSTRNQANVTAKGMESLASRIQNYSGQTDDSIVKTEQLLLTFTNIRNEAGKNNKIFDETTKIAADMAQRLGGDASGAAIQLGKALNDPVKGITALTRVGVSFTQQQKDQIAKLVEGGDTLKAQKVILHELNKEFGGSARLYGHTLPGQIDRLKRSYEDVTQELAQDLLPYARRFTKWVRHDALPALEDFGGWVKDHKSELEWFGGIVGGLAVGFKAFKGIRSIQSLVGRGPLGGGSVASRATPLPVYVTNWGPGGKTGPGGGTTGGGFGSGIFGAAAAALSTTNVVKNQINLPHGASVRDRALNAVGSAAVFGTQGGEVSDANNQLLFIDKATGISGRGLDRLENKLKNHTGPALRQNVENLKNLNQLLVVNPGLTTAAADANDKLAGSMKHVIGNAKIEAAVVGHDLGRGLIEGIEAEIPHVTVAGKLLVAQTVKSMRYAAEANSPSRATQRLGHDMGDGLIKGLQDREDGLRKQIDRMFGVISNVRSRAQGIYSGVRSGILGNASLLNTPNQSVGGIESFLRHELHIDRQFESNLALLRKKGYRKGLVTRLGIAGPEAAGNLVRQLASARRSDVSEIDDLQGAIARTAGRTGAFVRDDVNGFNKRLDTLHKDLAGLRDDLRAVVHEIRGAQHKATARTSR